MLFGEYYTLRAASAVLGVSYESLYKRVTRKHIPTKRAGKTIMVRLKDLQAG